MEIGYYPYIPTVIASTFLFLKRGKCVFFSFYAVFWKILHTSASKKLWQFCDLDTFLPTIVTFMQHVTYLSHSNHQLFLAIPTSALETRVR